MAKVERILKNERMFSFHPDNNNALSGNEMQVHNPPPKGATILSFKTFQRFGINDPITIARNSLTPLSSP